MKKLVSILLTVALLMTCMTCLPVFAAEEGAEPVELTDIEGVTFSASSYSYYPGGNRWNKSSRAIYRAFDNDTSTSALIFKSGQSNWYQVNLPAPAKITEVSFAVPSARDYWSDTHVKLSKNGDFSDLANGNTVDLGIISDEKRVEVPTEFATEKYSYIRFERNINFDFQVNEIYVKGYPDETDTTVPEGIEATVLSTNSGVILEASNGSTSLTAVNDGNKTNSATISYVEDACPEGGAWISMKLPFPCRLTQISVDTTVASSSYGYYIEAYNSKNPGTYEIFKFDPLSSGKTTITCDVKNTNEYDYVRVRSQFYQLSVHEITVSGYAAVPEIIAECNIENGATNVSNPNLTEKVTVTFNQTMDAGTLNGSNVRLTALNEYVGQYAVASDKRSISFDMKYLKPHTAYTLTIKKAISNTYGVSPSEDKVLVTFTTGNIYVAEDCEGTTLKNVSLGKTISSPNSFSNINNVINGEINNGSDGKNEFTIDLGAEYTLRAVDFFVNNGWGSEHKSWEVYGHNEPTTDLSSMTPIEYTLSDADKMVSGVGKYRIILNNTEAYRYITLKRGSHHLYELSVWATVIETLGTYNFDIATLDVSGDVATGFAAAAKINNFSEEETNAPKLIIAAYNGEALEAVKVSEVDIMDAKASGEITAAIPAASLAGKTVTNVKTFILTNLNDITPIIKARQLNIAE